MFWTKKNNDFKKIHITQVWNSGTVIHQLLCHDNDENANNKEVRELVQKLIISILKEKKCIITGRFCREDLDKINQSNIIQKLENIDKSLIKKNKKREKKNMKEINYFVLKDININNNLFEIAPWNFNNITIWLKNVFNEDNLTNKHQKLYKETGVLCKISIVEIDYLEIYISNELTEYRDNLFKELQRLGYQIVEAKTYLS